MLIGDEASQNYVKVLLFVNSMKSVNIDGRMNDFSGSTVSAAYSLCYHSGIRYEMVWAAGGGLVPKLQTTHKHGQQRALSGTKGFSRSVVVKAPSPPHRSMAIADMQCVRASFDTYHIGHGTGYD